MLLYNCSSANDRSGVGTSPPPPLALWANFPCYGFDYWSLLGTAEWNRVRGVRTQPQLGLCLWRFTEIDNNKGNKLHLKPPALMDAILFSLATYTLLIFAGRLE